MTRHLLMPPRRILTASHWDRQKLPGSAKAQLIVDDSALPQAWIVKSIHSGQGDVPGDQSAFNDYVGSRIAEAAGFVVGEVGVMLIDDEFLEDYPHLRGSNFGSFAAGEHFAVKYYPGSQTLDTYDTPVLRAELRAKCINPEAANHVAAFDSGTVNWDRSIPHAELIGENPGNLLFRPAPGGVGIQMTIIDQGYCFGAKWDTQIPPIFPHSLGAWPNGVFGIFHSLSQIDFYDQSDVMNALTKLQNLTVADINSIVQEVPASWLGFTTSSQLALLVGALTARIAGYGRIITADYPSVHAKAKVKT